MSLVEVNSWDIVKKQYRYKLKSYLGVFSSLIIIQVLAIFFSLNGTGMSGGSSGTFSYKVNYYSGDLILVFMMLWGFITAIIITTKAYRYDDTSFVTNRLTSHFSNILFLISASLFAGLTVFLSSHLFRLITNIMNVDSIMVNEHTPLQIAKGIIGAGLYIFLFTSIGYLVGMLIQKNKLFSFFLPIVLVGAMYLDGMNNDVLIFHSISLYFLSETLLSLLIIKIMSVSLLFYGFAIILSARMEVRA
ncbi:hypothetical protein KUV80_16230 [Fictibacillus nanhaiensis]|uniref:hypothetical protein n=1 Tax=Fictibacillus nanhaiensis TaxID=742169 RepID=UPI001C98068D|nr:hypothetical protein [Fictibacillus nanhaiensis]MBY6038209.1 hypothetical protein [Fictibacillus nanhaiensis]